MKILLSMAVAAAMLFGASQASAATYHLYTETPDGRDYNDKLLVDVNLYSSDSISFTFMNKDVEMVNLTQIGLEGTKGLIASPLKFDDQLAGFDFYSRDKFATNRDGTMAISAYALDEAPTAAEQTAQYVTWTFMLESGVTYDKVLSAIDSGGLKLSAYTQDGYGDTTYYTSGDVSPVPLPAGVWLMLSALGGLGAFSHFRKAKA